MWETISIKNSKLKMKNLNNRIQMTRITANLILVNPHDQYNSHSIDFKNSTVLDTVITVNDGYIAVRVINK